MWIRYIYQGFQDICIRGFPAGSDGKESACNARDLGSIPGLGRSPGEGKGYSLQYSGLENSMDRGAWRAIVHWVTKSWTELSDQHFHTHTRTHYVYIYPLPLGPPPHLLLQVITEHPVLYRSFPLTIYFTHGSLQHHRLGGHEFEQPLGDGEGQGYLMCCSLWGCRESSTT